MFKVLHSWILSWTFYLLSLHLLLQHSVYPSVQPSVCLCVPLFPLLIFMSGVLVNTCRLTRPQLTTAVGPVPSQLAACPTHGVASGWVRS